MVKSHAAPQMTPPSLKGGDALSSKSTSSPKAGNAFMGMAVTMSWQLALVVLIPILGGVELDKNLSTSFVCTLIGLGVALVGSGVVMWRTLQTANKLPVPKLSAEQKLAIQKQYQEDDADA